MLRAIYEGMLGEALLGFHTVQTGPGRFRAELSMRPGTPAPRAADLEAAVAEYLREPVQVEVHEVALRPAARGKRRSFTYAA
jgi:predicted TIM-barrel fold metal-dependent hydrolase